MEVVVTPFVGVWIETAVYDINPQVNQVTPFVGVWIETNTLLQEQQLGRSHPSWVCGLKQE